MIDLGIIENDRMTVSVLRYMLRRCGDFRVLWAATTAVEGLRCCFQSDGKQPDVVLIDIMLEGISGLDVCREIRRNNQTIGVVCITAYAVGSFADRAVYSGAQAIISKDRTIVEIADTIRAVAHGKASCPFRSAIEAHDLLVAERADADDAGMEMTALSSMELAVMRAYHEGFSTREIARQHHIVPSTVLVHAHHVMAKLGVHTRVEAVRICLRDHLI
ncbi:DNA-binding response regulator [Bifidobacterium avesanii]|nr:DNA-binding response regulator [Bifidobacterium avesanii]